MQFNQICFFVIHQGHVQKARGLYNVIEECHRHQTMEQLTPTLEFNIAFRMPLDGNNN